MQNYVYAYINPIDSQIFYIGKGSNKRAWRHLCDSKNLEKHESYRYFYRKINKIRQLILRDPDVQLLYTGLDAETAYSIEENLIQTLGRKGLDENGILCNRAKGGKGNRGVKFSKEACEKISRAKKGKKLSDDVLNVTPNGA